MVDVANMSEAQKRELLELIETRDRLIAEDQLSRYKPYAKQKAFHDAGSLPGVHSRLLVAANQCVSPWTFIETPDSTALAGEVFFSEGVRVRSWDGESQCAAQLRNGVLKGIEPAFRLVTEQGRFFDASPKHQILTESGWMHIDQLVSLSSGWRCSHKVEGYQASCVGYGYLDDPQLPLVEGSDLARLLGTGGALTRTLTFSREGVEGRILPHTSASLEYGLLSIAADGPMRRAALFSQFAGPAVRSADLALTNAHRDVLRFVHGLTSVPQPCSESQADAAAATGPDSSSVGCLGDVGRLVPELLSAQGARLSLFAQSLGGSCQELLGGGQNISIFYPCQSPKLVCGERIIAVVPIGYQPIIDAQVEDTHCYVAAGVVHHNSGKTWSAGFETAMHLTGRYPDWWKGKRFKKATTGWAASVTNQGTRDTVQRIVMGPPGAWGTGSIPKANIVEIKRAAHGVADAIDTVLVKHLSGGVSRLGFKSYDQGRERFQGETLDFVWPDEEPPEDVFMEMSTRTNATKGILYMTFTPLLGISSVVKRFLIEKAPGTHVTTMTLDDAEHYSAAERAAIIAKYPAHERDARTKGIPSLGSGRIFPLADEAISVAPFDIPKHWPRICGMDIGWDHPTAAAWLAWDREVDCVYVYATHRVREQTPIFHAASIRAKGDWIPVAWPHDALQHDKGSGEAIAAQYKRLGVNMLREKASWPDRIIKGQKVPGGNSVEAGVVDMLDRMKTGRWKVFSHCQDWFEEFRLYHRKEGKIVKDADDIISSARYGLMMLRHAVTHADVRQELPFVATEIMDETCNY